jgi:aminoglycoside phosphotransferase (APT) family kinase protein
MPSRLPTDASGVSPQWLTWALEHRHPGVDVEAVELLRSAGATNLHLRVGLRYRERAGAPETLFVKLPPPDASHAQAIGAAGMGRREANFYSLIAPSLSMRVPTAHFAQADEDGAFALLLEDLAVEGIRITDGSWAVPGALAARALEELAELHVRFEDPAALAPHQAWASPAPPSDRRWLTEKLRQVITDHADEISADYIAVAELYIDHHGALEQLWAEGPKTFLHGDPHIGNLFLDGDRVGFLDWGMTTIGSAMRDVSYFITMGVEPDDRRRMQRDLLQHYIEVRRALGGVPISFDDAWASHRLLAGYTVIASFLGLTPPYNTEVRRPFSSAFRNRSMLALEDLETVAAIRAAVG